MVRLVGGYDQDSIPVPERSGNRCLVGNSPGLPERDPVPKEQECPYLPPGKIIYPGWRVDTDRAVATRSDELIIITSHEITGPYRIILLGHKDS